ncbi:hypothetical protein J2Y57_000331 [Sphingomonas sp. BE137]|nr:hypothetical protein [Sphingomonas sp. BE137]
MMRHLIPLIEYGSWSGAALSDDGSPQGDEVRGWSVCIQWLGLLIEIGIGAVR